MNRHLTLKDIAKVAAVGGLAAIAILPLTADAGKGNGNGNGNDRGGGGSSSLAVRLLDPADEVINHGDWITFDVVSSSEQPVVVVECYQGSTLVMTSSAGFFDAYPWSRNFELASMAWTEGGAECTAVLQELNRRKWSAGASLSFSVAG